MESVMQVVGQVKLSVSPLLNQSRSVLCVNAKGTCNGPKLENI